MAHYGRVKIMLPTHQPYISAEILRRYLPGLWQQYAAQLPPPRSIRPALYLRRADVDEDTQTALQYLFWYLAAMDETSKNRQFLLRCLEYTWETFGHRQGKRIFLALGRILSPRNFGCNHQICLTMGTFVTMHSKEISVLDWIEYIKALDDIDPSGSFDLEGLLSLVPWRQPTRFRDLQTHPLVLTLGPRPLQLLNRLIKQGDGNAHRFGPRGGPSSCPHHVAWAQGAWDLDERREEPYSRWTESLDNSVRPYGQCPTCFGLFGPYYTRDRRPALPRARSARALHHVAHHDNYETRSSPWEVSDFRRTIPRFMRPFLHDAAIYEDWFPRHGRVVEVLS